MKPMSRRLYAVTALVLAAIIFTGLNIAVDAYFTTARIDLTANGRFTLAKGTRDIIRNIPEPITLKFFYSKKVAADYAQTRAYAGRVRDLLQEYAALSHGKIVLEEVDPEPYTAAEDEATADGLSAAPTDSGDEVYFGLAGSNRIGGKEAIAYFAPDREPYLEYDISSLIYRLSTPEKPKLAILSSLPLDTGPGGMAAMMQGRAQPYAIYAELQQTYDTEMLEPNFTAIPKGVAVLAIVHPGLLNEAQTYAIDQFVLKGGRALVFVDPNAEMAQASQSYGQQGPPPSSVLPRLFQAWGIRYNANKVIGDRELAQRVQLSNDPRDPVGLYPLWLHLTADQFDPDDPVTANLQTLNLASAGALFPARGATTKFTTLVSSSDQAALLDASEARFNPAPQELMGEIVPAGKPYAIAARISGPARTAFPDGPPAGASGPEIKSAKAINLVVMADSDIFDDRFWVRTQNLYGKEIAAPFADNGAFVLNAVENLMGSSDLISLRTRASNDRPFTVVQQLQAAAQAQFQQEEQSLQTRLTDTQDRLRALQQGGQGKSLTLTPEQQAEIDRFKRQLIETRESLRAVQHNLNKDIDALGAFLAFVNIALVPLLVACFAIVLAVLRRRRRARATPL